MTNMTDPTETQKLCAAVLREQRWRQPVQMTPAGPVLGPPHYPGRNMNNAKGRGLVPGHVVDRPESAYIDPATGEEPPDRVAR